MRKGSRLESPQAWVQQARPRAGSGDKAVILVGSTSRNVGQEAENGGLRALVMDTVAVGVTEDREEHKVLDPGKRHPAQRQKTRGRMQDTKAAAGVTAHSQTCHPLLFCPATPFFPEFPRMTH